MNTDLITNATTMSSKEIAELTGKTHFNVIRDIRTMMSQVLDLKDNSILSYQENQGITEEIDTNTKRVAFYRLDKNYTLTLLTGYDAKARFRVIKRWQELEVSNKPSTPTTYLEALKALVESETRTAVNAPKVSFYDHIAPEESSVTISQFAKMLSDAHNIQIGTNKLFDYLRACKYLMKGRDIKEHNVPYLQWSMSGNGWFDITYNKTTLGTIPQTFITLSGQTALADQIVAYFSKG